MRLKIFILVLISGVLADDLATDCAFPEDIPKSRLTRLHHPCESNQNRDFAIVTHENYYCIFYSTFEINVFGAESKFEITVDGEFDYEVDGAENFVKADKKLKFSASTSDVTLKIRKVGVSKPRISSVVIQDGALSDEPTSEFCTCRNCGTRSDSIPLILGGSDADPGSWPWNAAIYYRADPTSLNFRCGGTIINQRTLITTATCLFTAGNRINPEKLQVVANEVALYGPASTRLQIKRVITHEDFWDQDTAGKKLKHDYNVGLMITKTDIPFSLRVQPICLPTSTSFDFDGKRGFVVGWGYDKNHQLSMNLKQLDVPIWRFMKCWYEKRSFFSGHSSKRNFCAGYNSERGICTGDSGGGLFTKVDGTFQLLGLASASNCKCVSETQSCEIFAEGVYVNISYYLQWIHNNMY